MEQLSTAHILSRFFSYIKIDTESDAESKKCPSTAKQFDLAHALVQELQSLGIEDAHVDDNCYVMATLPANTDKKVPVIGLIAHLDTSPDMCGKNVNPQVIESYDGKDIVLNKENNIVLSPDDFPELKQYQGKKLITTDGTTLLGADDKAGITAIMSAVEFLTKNPDFKHGTIKIGFTPDEEIGRGADHFDVEKFGADFAYTIDGGEIGELEYETFNAAHAKIKVNGRNVHPGKAKDKMKNAVRLAMELNSILPVNQKPEYTEHYDGFFHLMSLNGDVENADFQYIIRDHDRDKFEHKKQFMCDAIDFMNKKHGKNTFELDMKDQYYNMREKIEPVMHIVDLAKEAMEELGIEPKISPIRGGTDGARLSFMGLPTPNIFTGGHNFHGKYEFLPVGSMIKSTEVILKIIEKSVR